MKKYVISHEPTWAQIVVEVDMDFEFERPGLGEKIRTEDLIKDMVDFWADWEEKLADNDDDYLRTFLKQLCEHVMRMLATSRWNEKGVIEEMMGEEGWYPMDGSCGIKIVSVSEMEFNQDDFEIKEK